LQQILFRNGDGLLTHVLLVQLCRERGIDVGKNLEDLVEPSDLQNVRYAFLNTGERESAAVFLNLLHAFDEGCEPGAVEVSHFGKIDHHDFGFLAIIVRNDSATSGETWRSISPSSGKNVRLFF